jgi:hypothetical protein
LKSLNRAKPGLVKTEVLSEAAAYEAKLRAMPAAEVERLCQSERNRSEALARAEAEAEEKQRFYNKPHASADFGHWATLAYWTVEEAVALTFGKEPNVVQWKHLLALTAISTFAVTFEKRREIVRRANVAKELGDPTVPGAFIVWAKRNNIPVPPELESGVAARGEFIGDWKTHYDELKERYGELTRSRDELFAQHSELLRSAEQQNATMAKLLELRDALAQRIESMEAAARQVPEQKELKTRERDSALKLIIGMAVRGYRYDPKAQRNDATSDICDDLERLGVGLDPDTVRKWLRKAAELLPPRDDS